EALHLQYLAPRPGRVDRVVARGERGVRGRGRGPGHVHVHVQQLRPVHLAERRGQVGDGGPQVGGGPVADHLEPGQVERTGLEIPGRGVLVGAGPVVVPGRVADVEHRGATALVADRHLRVPGAPQAVRAGTD